MAHRVCANFLLILISVHKNAHAFSANTKSALLHGHGYSYLLASSIFVSQWLRKQASLQKKSIQPWRRMTGFLVCKHVEDVGVEWINLLSYTFSISDFSVTQGFLCKWAKVLSSQLIRSVFTDMVLSNIGEGFHFTRWWHFLQYLSAIWKPKPLINKFSFMLLPCLHPLKFEVISLLKHLRSREYSGVLWLAFSIALCLLTA